MSEDDFTEVTEESWFSRIGGAIKGVLIGLVLTIVAFPLLFWNEGRAVKRYKTLKEGAGAVISVSADNIDAANAGKLVHVTGRADTKATLSDPVFSISQNAIKLKRTVEMYQWKETTDSKTEKKIGGGTKTVKTYNYDKNWSESRIDSSGFKRPDEHRNPDSMPYTSNQWDADDVSLGAFTLSRSLVSRIGNYKPLPVESGATVPQELQGKAQTHSQGFYIGTDPGSPQIGDCRVNFKVVKPIDVTVVSKQIKNTFEPYKTEVKGTIELLQTGIVSADAMFQKAQDQNKMLTWILRFAGFIVMFIGLLLILKPLSVLADVLPILGNIVGAGAGIISFLSAGTLSLITISIAWIVYRPLMGIILLAVAVGLTVAIGGKLRSAKKAEY